MSLKMQRNIQSTLEPVTIALWLVHAKTGKSGTSLVNIFLLYFAGYLGGIGIICHLNIETVHIYLSTDNSAIEDYLAMQGVCDFNKSVSEDAAVSSSEQFYHNDDASSSVTHSGVAYVSDPVPTKNVRKSTFMYTGCVYINRIH